MKTLISLYVLISLSAFAGEIPEWTHNSVLRQLENRREAIRDRLAVCGPGPFEGQYSHWANGICEQGDTTAYNGLSCLAAVLAEDEKTADDRCNNIVKSQGPDGRWWRAPSLIGVDRNGASTFSRDMTRGVFAYLLAKGHFSNNEDEREEARARATSWLDWFMTDGNFRLCPEDKNGCQYSSGVRSMFFHVYRTIETLPPRPPYRGAYWNEDYTRSEHFIRGLYGIEWYLRWGLNLEIPLLALDRDLRKKFYPYNLKASSIVIYRASNMNRDFTVREERTNQILTRAAKNVNKGFGESPYFEFLHQGVTEKVLNETLRRCPEKLGPPPYRYGDYRDWQWQRSNEEKTWEYGDGHDCVYMLNLMIARLKGRFNW